jgi:predicted MFS family arabinose efflux permease
MASGLQFAWPMVLFTVLGSSFENLGFANALAGLAGAAGGLICGRAIDRGSRDKYLLFVCFALAIGFALRAAAGWSAVAALIANASAAAVMGVYIPVLMSHIYDRAKASGAAYRFHFTTEAGWDAGAASACLVAASFVAITDIASLAVVPGALGIVVMYVFVRQKPLGIGGSSETQAIRAVEPP